MSSRQSRGVAGRLQQSDVSSWLQSRQRPSQRHRGRAVATADTLPPEVLLQIFRYMSPRSLVSCSMVNRLWADIAISESLWRPICHRCFPKQPEPFGVQLGADCGIWKATFFNRLRKHAASRKYLTSLSNFSIGDFRVTLDFLGDSGRSLEASLSARVRKPGRHSSIVAFSSSGGNNCLPSDMRRVSQLVCRATFPAAHPDLLPAADCPRRAVVLFNRATDCQTLAKLSRDSRPGASDASCVTVRLLGDGLLVGEWTEDNGGSSAPAFVRLLLSHELAVNAARAAALGASESAASTADKAGAARATAGSSKNAATVSTSIRRGASSTSTASVRSARNSSLAAAIPAAALLPCQVSSLSAILILKEHRGEEFVFNTWRCVDLLPSAGDWLTCQLIDPRRRGDHMPYDCEPEFRWRAGAAGLEGRVGDACYCDFVLHSGPSGAGSGGKASTAGALWSITEPAFFSPASENELDGANVEYEYDGPKLSLNIANSTGRLRLLVVKDAIGGRGYLVGAWLELSSHYVALREA